MTHPKTAFTPPLDVVGIGNAIVDVVIQVEESFLSKHGLVKGSMTLIDQAQAQELYNQSGPGFETSGGSAANTLVGLSMLGGKGGFIGRVSNDQLGESFIHDIRSVGTIYDTPMASLGPSTARCLILVTPDAQRTMCTYLGASVQLQPEDLDLTIIKKAKVLYLEGYLWDNDAAKRAFVFAAKTCKELGRKVALTLSDSFCVNRHRESFLELVNGHIDILFANEAEIKSLFQTESLEESIKELDNHCELAIITLSEKGSIIISNKERISIPAYSLAKVIDTTGAGDLYAGGFLFGYTQGYSLTHCGKIGSICAGQIVTQLGPRSKTSLKMLIDDI